MATKAKGAKASWSPKGRRRFFGFMREILGLWLPRKFRLRFQYREVLEGLKPPYLLLPNHVGFWDPFIAGLPIRHPIHFMVADSNYRSPVLRRLLEYIESIPKTKSRSDMESVKRMLAIRSAGGVICIFPEGRRTWDGRSLPLIYSTTKLIKLLKIPVITAVIDGMYHSHPCWAPSVRRGPVTVTYRRLFDGEELRDLSSDDIYERLSEALKHDDHRSQSHSSSHYRSRRPAEFLERALYTCPSCRATGRMRSKRNRLFCRDCGYTVRYTQYGWFEPETGNDVQNVLENNAESRTEDVGENNTESLFFRTPAAWNDWQIAYHLDRISRIRPDDFDRVILKTSGLELAVGSRSLPVETAGFGTTRLYRDRIEFSCRRPRRRLLQERGRFAETDFTQSDNGVLFVFPLHSVSGWNVQNHENFEWYYGHQLFRVRDPRKRFSGYNWYSFINMLNGRHPQAAHLEASAYVPPETASPLVHERSPAVQ